ncbi:MAG: hypothetical protein IT186_25935 [Acidobacteria bacterium]|nr:hypothetical protein [Acidobacteriota bacterium]
MSAGIVDAITAMGLGGSIDVAGRSIPLCIALRNPLVLSFSAAMNPAELQADSDRRETLVGFGSAVFETFGNRAGGQKSEPSESSVDALILAREPDHFDALGPVARMIAEHGGQVRWHLYRGDHRSRVATGEWRMANPTMSTFLSETYRRTLREGFGTESWIDLRRSIEGLVGDSRVVRSLVRIYQQVAASFLPRVVATVMSLEKEILRRRPTAILIGNPATIEGRIGVELATHFGIPTLAIQHGTLMREDPLWMGLPVTLFCVWGESGRSSLHSCGYDDDRIAVTGDPAQHRERVSRPDGGRRVRGKSVLVLLSGEGHMTGRVEHRSLVKTCVNAAALSESIHWHFRLHKKDRPEVYADTIRGVGVTNCSVSPPGGGNELGKDLERATVVVATTSTAAIEALAAGVPVVSVDRPEGEYVPDIVAAGLTVRVVSEASILARAVRRLQSAGPEADRAAETARFLDNFFGVDGVNSTGRIHNLLLAAVRR